MTENHSSFTTSAAEVCIVEGCVITEDGTHSVAEAPAPSKLACTCGTDTMKHCPGCTPTEADWARVQPVKRRRRTKAEIEAAKAADELVVETQSLDLYEPVNPEPVEVKPSRKTVATDDEDVDPVGLVAEAELCDATAEGSGAADILDVIRAGMQERERAPMGNIGPSMLGGCERKMGHQLAFGSDGYRDDESWIATVGTAGHAWLDDVIKRQVEPDGSRRWYPSKWITLPVRGVIDVYDAHRKEVVDFKMVGATTLGKARKGEVDRKYDVQLDVYGVGMLIAGYAVERVAALFLPKTQGLGKAVWYSRPLDVGRAVAAVENLRRVEAIIRPALAQVVVTDSGREVIAGRPVMESALDSLTPTEDFCKSCPALAAGYCKGVVTADLSPTGWAAWDAVLEGMRGAA